jgi:CubicO group peptidase (beta-lactamase class C family)
MAGTEVFDGPVSGAVHDDFDDVRSTFRRQLGRTTGGAAVAIYHRGVKVVDLWGGTRDEFADRGPEPWQRDTLTMCFSTTKGVVSTAVHMLADRGLIDYDEPVATYWPEFARNGKERVTVRHLLAHNGGLPAYERYYRTLREKLEWGGGLRVAGGRSSAGHARP